MIGYILLAVSIASIIMIPLIGDNPSDVAEHVKKERRK